MLRKKHLWLPAVLLIYTFVMAWMNRELITVHHKYGFFFATLGAELAVITLLYFFLKKRERLRREREEDMNSQGR